MKIKLIIISILLMCLAQGYCQYANPQVISLEVVQYSYPGLDSAQVPTDSTAIVDTTTYNTDMDVIIVLRDTGQVQSFYIEISGDGQVLYSYTKSFSDNLFTGSEASSGQNTFVKLTLFNLNLPLTGKEIRLDLLNSSGQTIHTSSKNF